jgi:hypothetical protein
MDKKSLVYTFFILIIVGGLLRVSVRVGDPQSYWSMSDQRKHSRQTPGFMKEELPPSFPREEAAVGTDKELCNKQIPMDIPIDVQHVSSPTPTPVQRTGDGNSGITGTIRFRVISGVPGGPTTEKPASIEFAIAPIENDTTAYSKAIVIKSDAQGMFKVALPPGTYWIGPKAKALDPGQYVSDAVVFSEAVVVVQEGTFTHVELVQTGYAP